jgi:AcrR family transcriptional regulator
MSIAVEKITRSSHEDFLIAGISLIARRGIDSITVADVSKTSGYTRATFYSYFGDLDGLYAEIWMLYGRLWLESMAHDTVPYKSDEDKLRCNAILEIFIASKRKPSVYEVVLPTVINWWTEATCGNKAMEAKLSWVVAANIGIAASKHLAPAVTNVQEILSLIRELPTDEVVLETLGFAPAPNVKLVHAELESPETVSEDEDDKIKGATIEVVAAAGVADASMTRIARNLQVSTGSVYPRFKNVSDVIGEAFSWSIQKIVSDNTAAYFATSANADSYASIIVASLSEPRRSWRNFRLEMYLASRFRESLSKTMIPGLELSDAVLEGFVRKNGVPERHVTQIVGLMHALGIGFSALQNAGIDVNVVDHRLPTRYLVSVLSILKSPGVAASEIKHSIAEDAIMSAMGSRQHIQVAAGS